MDSRLSDNLKRLRHPGSTGDFLRVIKETGDRPRKRIARVITSLIFFVVSIASGRKGCSNSYDVTD
jgi:hypothetical protein